MYTQHSGLCSGKFVSRLISLAKFWELSSEWKTPKGAVTRGNDSCHFQRNAGQAVDENACVTPPLRNLSRGDNLRRLRVAGKEDKSCFHNVAR